MSSSMNTTSFVWVHRYIGCEYNLKRVNPCMSVCGSSSSTKCINTYLDAVLDVVVDRHDELRGAGLLVSGPELGHVGVVEALLFL